MVNFTSILLVLSYLFVFLFGRVYGRIESSIIFSQRINAIIDAIRRVENLASLKGEDLSKVPTQEIIERTKKQMEIKLDD